MGSGYFDVVHETLLSGRLISEADVKRKENVIVIDESTALSFFAGDDPLNGKVTLNGVEYEVAGVIKGGRRLGETDEHVAYIPITAASGNALAMQTVEIVAKTNDSTTGSAILMRDSLEAWRTGGSFYNYDKLTMGRDNAPAVDCAVCRRGISAEFACPTQCRSVGENLLLRRTA